MFKDLTDEELYELFRQIKSARSKTYSYEIVTEFSSILGDLHQDNAHR